MVNRNKNIGFAIIALATIALLVLSGCTTGQVTTGDISSGSNTAAGGNTGAGNSGTASGSQTADNSNVKIPLAELSAQAKWYEYAAGGTTVRFFAVEASDGSIKTAFDACDVCYKSKKGYRQEGTNMVCNNCGNKYPIDGLGTKNRAGGGCWPSFLPSKIVGNELVIAKADLEKGKVIFA